MMARAVPAFVAAAAMVPVPGAVAYVSCEATTNAAECYAADKRCMWDDLTNVFPDRTPECWRMYDCTDLNRDHNLPAADLKARCEAVAVELNCKVLQRDAGSEYASCVGKDIPTWGTTACADMPKETCGDGDNFGYTGCIPNGKTAISEDDWSCEPHTCELGDYLKGEPSAANADFRRKACEMWAKRSGGHLQCYWSEASQTCTDGTTGSAPATPATAASADAASTTPMTATSATTASGSAVSSGVVEHALETATLATTASGSAVSSGVVGHALETATLATTATAGTASKGTTSPSGKGGCEAITDAAECYKATAKRCIWYDMTDVFPDRAPECMQMSECTDLNRDHNLPAADLKARCEAVAVELNCKVLQRDAGSEYASCVGKDIPTWGTTACADMPKETCGDGDNFGYTGCVPNGKTAISEDDWSCEAHTCELGDYLRDEPSAANADFRRKACEMWAKRSGGHLQCKWSDGACGGVVVGDGFPWLVVAVAVVGGVAVLGLAGGLWVYQGKKAKDGVDLETFFAQMDVHTMTGVAAASPMAGSGYSSTPASPNAPGHPVHSV